MAEIKKKKKKTLAANHHLPYRIEDFRLVFPVSVPSLFFYSYRRPPNFHSFWNPTCDLHSINMSERQSSVDPSAMMTSSADRMVGDDHAEVRYFTRYEESPTILTCQYG